MALVSVQRSTLEVVFLMLIAGVSLCLDAMSTPSGGHSIQGRVFAMDTPESIPIKVSLIQSDKTVLATRTLGYDRTFSFEDLPAGSYQLTIEQEDRPTVARPVVIKNYPTAKILSLEVRLSADSTTFKEVTTEPGERAHAGEGVQTLLSRKAAKEFQKGMLQSEKGNFEKAIEHLEKAVREAPNFLEAYNNLGTQYQRLERFDKAIECFQKAIAVRDDSSKPHINLATVYLLQGKQELAVRSFKAALRIDENSVPAHRALGQILFQQGNLSAAEEHLELATRLNPKESRNAFVLLAQIQLTKRDRQRARYFIESLLQYFPEDPDGLQLRKSVESLPSTE